MKVIDLHCDTIWKLTGPDGEGDLMSGNCDVLIPGMKKAGTLAQFFACFGYLEDFRSRGGYDACYEHVLSMLTYLKEQTVKYGDEISLAGSAEEIKDNEASGRISAVPAVEEGGVLNGSIERLFELYRQGVRLITLTWNHENCIGHPNSRDSSVMWQGLTAFGREVVEQMNGLGMLIDVSHASDGTFRDVMEHTKGPVIASHSNCRGLCDHPRNLTDEMIRALANAGGVAGLNFYGPFLGSPQESRIEEMTAHLRYMINVGGSEFPAIGTDLDGFDGMNVMDIGEVAQMGLLWQALERQGVSTGQIEKIAYGNAMRVLESLKR